MTANIGYINEANLPAALLIRVERALADVDPKDTPFVAPVRKLKARLWTGDRALVNGLKRSYTKLPITTAALLKRLAELEG